MSEHRPSIALRITWTSAWLTSAETKVLLALASAGDWETGQTCYPKWETLVARSGLSRATVARTLVRLENPRRPGGPLIIATDRRHRHSTTYDICPDRLATRPPKEQQVSLSPLLDTTAVESHDETQIGSESQSETQDPKFESHFETPTGTPDLDQERTHTPRAREADETPDLPLLGRPPLPRCQHPHAHAWCEGRVHVPRDLHFELLDKLGTRPGESPSMKAGRLVAFYADTMAQLSDDASIGNAYAFWNAAYQAWICDSTRRRAEAKPRIDVVSGSVCLHDPTCETRHACIDRTLAEARAERQRHAG